MNTAAKKALSAGLSLFLLLGGPGFEAYEAASASVITQRQTGAVPTAGSQVQTLPNAAVRSVLDTGSGIGTLDLKGSISISPVPGVHAAAPLAAQDRTAATLSPSAPTALPAPLAAPFKAAAALPQTSPQAGAVQAPLSKLQEDVSLIEESRRTDSSGQAERRTLDGIFQGRAPVSGIETDVPAAPSQELRHGALARPGHGPSRTAVQDVPSDTARTEQPKQSLARTFRVGWLAAILPLAFTFGATALAQALGYEMHPNYSAPQPAELTAAAVAAQAVFVSVMAPVSEEVAFRSGLMGGLRMLTRRIPALGDFWLPALLSSTIFVLLHETSDPLLIFTRLVHSMVLSYAYHKEGLASSMAAHAFFNGLLTLPLVLSFFLGPALGPIAQLAVLPLSAYLTFRAWKALKGQKADRQEGRLVPFVLSRLQAAVLAAVLMAGYFFMLANPIWIAGAIGLVLYAVWPRPRSAA